METSPLILSVLIYTAILAGWSAPPPGELFEIDMQHLAEVWQKEHISPADPSSLKHAQLKQRLMALEQESPDFFHIEQVGASVEGREIYLASLGSGTRPILLWSQMHGNEPTATCSLIDLLQFFSRHRQETWVADILGKYRILIMPMLNPDGAQREERRNAQGIDINRDARMMQTPEGSTLLEVRNRFSPFLGFNLHNQNSATTVGDTGKVATIALLAVAADQTQAVMQAPQPGVPDHLAKRVTAVLYEALSQFIYGHVSRYDDPYNPRAFGDKLTLMGTPVVLIESGGTPPGSPANLTVQLNFVGILAALNSLASGRINRANPAVFDALKLNSDIPIFDLMLRNAWIVSGTGVRPFRGDIGIRRDMRSGSVGSAIIADVGDLGIYSAHQTLDCSDTMVTPGLIAWDPESSLFSSDGNRTDYLRRGILAVLKTASWSDLQGRMPVREDWVPAQNLDWGFVLAGSPQHEDDAAQLRLASWLAAGARAWIPESEEDAGRLVGMQRVASWFSTAAIPRAGALRYQIPLDWSGDPARILARWTSEAAREFRLVGKGVIASGFQADLVIWSIPAGKQPAEIRDCRPDKVILGGRLFDLSQPEIAAQGRFLGRR